MSIFQKNKDKNAPLSVLGLGELFHYEQVFSSFALSRAHCAFIGFLYPGCCPGLIARWPFRPQASLAGYLMATVALR